MEKKKVQSTNRLNMDRPSDVLRGIAAKGRRIRAEIIAARQSKMRVKDNAGLAVDALDMLFDLSGHKKTAYRMAKRIGESSSGSKMLALESEVDTWMEESKESLRNMTVMKNKGIPDTPNSARLIQGFLNATSLKLPENRLMRGISFLEELAEHSIAYNDELKGMKESITVIENSRKREVPSDIEARLVLLVENLEGFSSVQEAVKGTLKAYRERGSDWARQAMSSMRNALESLVKILSGEGDWSKGLEKLIPRESGRKLVKNAYYFLSSMATHNVSIPSDQDVDYGIVVTEGAIRYIVDYPRAGPKTVRITKTQQIQKTSNARFEK